MGIRKKIVLGFILIGILLLMSGILTSFELAKINGDTAKEIKNQQETLYLSKQLMDFIQQNNMAILTSISDSLNIYDSILTLSMSNFDKTLLQLKSKDQSRLYCQRIEAAYSRYKDVLKKRPERSSFDWFINVYSQSYSRLTYSIKDFLMNQQDNLLKYTTVLEYNIYRALMIGVIAFAASIFLLIAFYFLLSQFFLSPVLKMEKSLRDFLKARIPYSVKIDTTDEIHDLSSHISDLCAKSKNDFD